MRRLVTGMLIGVTLAGTAAADPPAPLVIERDVSTLRLRPEVAVSGANVLVRDVIDFATADERLEREIGDKPLFETPRASSELEINHPQIVDRLDALGVNLARVLVSGAYSCRVSLRSAAPDQADRNPDDAAPMSSPLRDAPEASGATRTLADTVRAYVEVEFESADGAVEVEFERGRQEFLDLSSPPFEFVVRSPHSRQLGLCEFRVTIQRDGRRQRTVSVFARVRLVRKVLVAAKPLNVGGTVRADAVEYATRIFDDDDEPGIAYVEQLIGQRVKRFVPEGRMIRRDDVEAVDLVARNRPVTVLGGGSISLRLTGRALDSGGFGESVRVQLGDSRANRRIIRAVVSGVAQVRLTEDD